MRLLVDAALFDQAALRTAPPFFLEQIFSLCLGRHALVCNFDTQVDTAFIKWKTGLTQTNLDAVEAVVREGLLAVAREHSDSVINVSAGSSDWATSPPTVGGPDLLKLLRSPMIFLVEHAEHDGALLKTVGFGVDGENFRIGVARGEIVFEHGGGSSTVSIIRAKGSDPIWRHRTWVVADSDALVPGTPSTECELKRKLCNESGVRFHSLGRRALENYIPHAELDERYIGTPIPFRKAIGAFGRLSTGQRAHFNMKNGFKGDEKRLTEDSTLAAGVSTLFDGLLASDRAALLEGFGRDVGECFLEGPGRPRISEARRRLDGQDVEMIPLFQSIIRSL